jgi:hypothetical protein
MSAAPDPHKEWSEAAVIIAFLLFILAVIYLIKP